MNYFNLTIAYQKGRKGTIGKIIELPAMVVIRANQAEVQTKIVEALTQHQKVGRLKLLLPKNNNSLIPLLLPLISLNLSQAS